MSSTNMPIDNLDDLFVDDLLRNVHDQPPLEVKLVLSVPGAGNTVSGSDCVRGNFAKSFFGWSSDEENEFDVVFQDPPDVLVEFLHRHRHEDRLDFCCKISYQEGNYGPYEFDGSSTVHVIESDCGAVRVSICGIGSLGVPE